MVNGVEVDLTPTFKKYKSKLKVYDFVGTVSSLGVDIIII